MEETLYYNVGVWAQASRISEVVAAVKSAGFTILEVTGERVYCEVDLLSSGARVGTWDHDFTRAESRLANALWGEGVPGLRPICYGRIYK